MLGIVRLRRLLLLVALALCAIEPACGQASPGPPGPPEPVRIATADPEPGRQPLPTVPSPFAATEADRLEPLVQSAPEMASPPAGAAAIDQADAERADAERFEGRFSNQRPAFDIGVDLYSPPEFEGGLIIYGDNVAMKIGGLVKADFIYDFEPIDETDSFVTTSIPVGAPHRTNTRFHARQSRLSFDTRWAADEQVVRIYVEGDFFSDADRFRLRHAYGEVGSLLVGQTWTTFTDVAAAPATLDFEGSVSSVNRRQAQARWTQHICGDLFTFAVAVEDPRFILDLPDSITAESRTVSPDFVSHLRMDRDWGRIQMAGLYRIGGIQATGASIATLGADVITSSAWGLNFTGVFLLTEQDKVYSQILFGDGIGSYRGLPDAAPASANTLQKLPLFGWMI